ncbi:MAG: hypothetical protein ABH983_01960 [Candidatus Micrarchaeota archaeon]
MSLTEEEEEKAHRHVVALGEEFERRLDESSSIVPYDLGVCTSCGNLLYLERKFGDEYEAYCVDYAIEKLHNIKIDHKNPIKKCSRYNKKGEMSLWDMKGIATLIDLNKKTIAGFTQDGKES